MTQIKRYTNCIQRYMHGRAGQRFFNFAYSFGAAIVIWGALFKILHLPGGNFLLCIGMGTEVLMFILTAFDIPPREYEWERVFPELADEEANSNNSVVVKEAIIRNKKNLLLEQTAYVSGGAGAPGSAGISGIAGVSGVSDSQSPAQGVLGADTAILNQNIASITAQLENLQATTKALNDLGKTLLDSYKAITDNSGEISESASGYAKQMADLNRNLSGLNTIYELQLRHISGQLESIDRVNKGLKDIRDMYEKSAGESARYCEESEKMARYMKQINAVYEKMITAMTIGIHHPMGNAGGINPFNTKEETE